MTGPENERLAVVETKVDALTTKVASLEGKVDILVERSASWGGASAFARGLVPFLAVGVSIAALVMSIAGS
jgi:hypothetical protein